MFLYSSFQYLLPGQWQSYWKFKKLTSRNGGLPSQNLSKSFDFKSLKFSSRTNTWGWRKTNKQFNESPTLFGSLKKEPNENQGPSWSYGSWIYNYLCNQCISCENPVQARCTRYNIDVIKFVSDLRQVIDFLPVLRFPPPIKLTAAIY
jgi:hypothetical protein